MRYFFPESPEHTDNFNIEWLKRFDNKYPPEDYKFSCRHQLFVKLINKFVPNKEAKILDVGCGLGDLLLLLRKDGYQNTVGIDHSQIAVNICRKNGFNVIKASLAEELPIEIRSNKWDVIILGDILEHIYVPVQVLLQLRTLLTDDGKIIVSVPNAGWIMNGLLLSFVPQLLWLSVMFASWTHIKFFTLYSLKKELINCGYEIVWLGGWRLIYSIVQK